MRTKLNISRSSKVNIGNLTTGLSRNKRTRLSGIPSSIPDDSVYRLLEDSDFRILENGDFRILE